MLENGYYLSVYFSIDKWAYLYDYAYRQEQNMALWSLSGESVELVKYWELEKKIGIKKYCKSFYSSEDAMKVISNCLEECGVMITEIKGIWGTPELDNNFLEFWDVNPYISDHAFNHLYSALLSNMYDFNNETIISLVLDGKPDRVVDKNTLNKKFYVGSISKNGKFEDVFAINSPELLWEHMVEQTGINKSALMILTTASMSECYIDAPTLLINNHKSMEKAYAVLNDIYNEIQSYTTADMCNKFNRYDERFTEKENKNSMYAKIVQKISLQVINHEIEMILKKYSLDEKKCCICISGEFGLNYFANAYILKKYCFKKILPVFCPGDTGMSLGIGLRAFYLHLKNTMKFRLSSPLLESKDEDTQVFTKYDAYIGSISELNSEIWINDIRNYPVLWFNGLAEIGSRSFGHRSLLAAPTYENKSYINKIRKREWWNPITSLVLQEDANEWFDVLEHDNPYMFRTCMIRRDKCDMISAIAHLDCTACIQIMERDVDLTLYELLQAYKKKTGIPVIYNISVNDEKKSIIDGVEEAITFGLKKRIPIVYINRKRVELINHDSFIKSRTVKTSLYRIIDETSQLKERRVKDINPFGLTRKEVGYICAFEKIRDQFDLQNEEDVQKVRKFITKIEQKTPINISEIL